MSNEHDDAKLTAYALGELDETERSAIATQIEHDEAAQREVVSIREMAAQLKTQLAAEPLPEPARSMKVLKLPRRPRWGARLAVAATVVVVSGVTVAIVLSIIEPARRQSRSTLARNEQVKANAMSQPDRQWTEKGANSAPVPKQFESQTDVKLKAGPVVAAKPVASPLPPQATRQPYAVKAEASASIDASLPAAQPATPPPTLYIRASVSEAESTRTTPARGLVTGLNGGTLAVRGTRFDLSANTTESRARGEGGGLGGSRLNTLPDDVGERDGGFNTESYDRIHDNPFLQVAQNPLSTFSIDVDTASYSNVRRILFAGQRPPKDAVRIEEFVNYFPYDYAPPVKDSTDPFAANVEVASCPWDNTHRLVRVGLKGKEIAADKRPASNLVFLLDVSGSMQPENKLPLVRRAMRMLLEQLNGEDRVAIVVYAGSSGLVLPSTTCTDANKASIFNAIAELSAGGSTNGEQGIQLAYTVARQNFIDGRTNRVILCTDGDFNVGVTNQGDLTRIIEEKAKAGVFLSVLGFGMGNLKDSTMEKLADKGNGNYAYIDTINEAKKVLVEQMSGTLITIAKDVKIQIEFNPAVVGSYRLIGYENRMLAKEDFNDDKKDAGEIGAGHAVTALYEIIPSGAKPSTTEPSVDSLKYQKPAAPPRETNESEELLTLKLRYKQPDGDTSKLLEVPVTDTGVAFTKASNDFKFASAVAAFGMILRDSPHKGTANLGAVLEWAEDGVAKDPSGYRQEFIELVKKAQAVGAAR